MDFGQSILQIRRQSFWTELFVQFAIQSKIHGSTHLLKMAVLRTYFALVARKNDHQLFGIVPVVHFGINAVFILEAPWEAMVTEEGNSGVARPTLAQH